MEINVKIRADKRHFNCMTYLGFELIKTSNSKVTIIVIENIAPL
jgi:hypothetical protein